MYCVNGKLNSVGLGRKVMVHGKCIFSKKPWTLEIEGDTLLFLSGHAIAV